jgi:transcriptional regulator with XRE-family HTH domain
MDYVNKNISINLKRIRTAKNQSLDMTAEQTGVSKSMLAKIERGEANPSIACLVKISSGLRIELNQLINSPREAVDLIPIERMVPTKELEGKYSIYTYFPYEKDRAFEIYGINLYPKGVYFSGSHGENTAEYITVTHGILILKIAGVQYKIRPGDAFRFDSDVEHWYCNESDEMTKLMVVFAFNENN